MSIKIIDNFDLGTDKPLDNRYVVGSGFYYTNKDQIDSKYPGLRVWSVDEEVSYIWDGSEWISENYIIGSQSYIPKFTSSNTIGNSMMYEDSGTVFLDGILDAQYIKGDGSQVSNVNASSITSGQLSINRIYGDENSIIVGNGTTNPAQWQNIEDVTIGNTEKINLSFTNSETTQYITMVEDDGSQNLFINNSIFYQPSSGKLNVLGGISIGTSSLPNDNTINVPNLEEVTESVIDPVNEIYNLVIEENTGALKKENRTTIPIGGIIMWPYDGETLPRGFVLCDGCQYIINGSTISTPDLQQRFIFGSGDSYNITEPPSINVNQESTFDILNNGNGDITAKAYGIRFIMFIGMGPKEKINCPGQSTG